MSNQNITYQIQKIMIIYRIFVGVKLDNRYKKDDENELLEEIKALDVLKMNPIEALNKLYELVEKSKK